MGGASNFLYWLAFFILGSLNNLGFVVVDAAAKPLAASFGKQQMVGAVKGANVSMGLVMRALNTFVFDGTSYSARIVGNGGMMLMGFVGACLSISLFKSFVVFLISVVLIGSSSTFGESALLTFTRDFPPNTVGGWSSGTGMAGVLGAALFLILHGALALDIRDVFTLMVPTSYIYICTFLVLNWKRPRTRNLEPGTNEVLEPLMQDEGHGAVSHESDRESPDLQEHVAKEVDKAQKMGFAATLAKAHRCHKLVLWNALNLGLVYFLEYTVTTGFAAVSGPPASEVTNKISEYAQKNHFVILGLCYQVGVFISRSSTALFTIRQVWIMTLLQILLFLVWLVHSLHYFMIMWVQYPVMIIVGLMGGASYVNVFLNIRTDTRIKPQDKEMAINVACIYINAGIVSACIFSLIANNTFLVKNID